MTRKILAVAGAALLAGGLQAQTVEKNVAFQYFFNNEVSANAVSGGVIRAEAMGGQTVTGKPLSANEVRRTRQTLGDGTNIDKTETDKYYRDNEGRTRIEGDNGATVMISDPQSGATTETSNGKSHVMMMRSGSFAGAAGEKGIAIMPAPEMHPEMLDKMKAEGQMQARTMVGTRQNVLTRAVEATPIIMPLQKGAAEDLGDQIVNGVMAHGTRSTITIPEGQIGNDREIRIVSERWYSNDLQMLIKSSNNDPRFGETTYELTNIVQGAQDPTLFQMPSNMKHPGER